MKSIDLADRRVFRALFLAAWESRARLFGALLLLSLARVASVLAPIALKHIVDALSHPEQVMALPVLILIGYALLRFGVVLFSELRDLVFSRVTQRTVARYAHAAFTQLLRMDVDFHAKRPTGGLLRDLDRGTNAIGYLMGVAPFTVLPTLLEILLVQTIVLLRYSAWFAVILGVTFLAYAASPLRSRRAEPCSSGASTDSIPRRRAAWPIACSITKQ